MASQQVCKESVHVIHMLLPTASKFHNVISAYPTRNAGADVGGRTRGEILSGQSSRIEIQFRGDICILFAMAVVNSEKDGGVRERTSLDKPRQEATPQHNALKIIRPGNRSGSSGQSSS